MFSVLSHGIENWKQTSEFKPQCDGIIFLNELLCVNV